MQEISASNFGVNSKQTPIDTNYLSTEQKTALNISWFILPEWDNSVSTAIVVCFAVAWAENIEKCFEDNAKQELPASWYALGKALGRDPKGFTRYNPMRGNKGLHTSINIPTSLVRYAASAALKVGDHWLSPDTQDLLARVAMFLVTQSRGATLLDFSDYQHFAELAFSFPSLQLAPNSTTLFDKNIAIQRALNAAEELGGVLISKRKGCTQ